MKDALFKNEIFIGNNDRRFLRGEIFIEQYTFRALMEDLTRLQIY